MNVQYYTHLARRALDEPSAIAPYVKRKVGNIYYELEYKNYREKNDIHSQKKLVHNLIREDDWVLIILDACRHDYFEQEYADFFSGTLQKVWSPANRTPKWMPNMWTEQYDLTYLSTSGYATSEAAYENKRITFDPEATFETIVPIQERDPVLTTVVPERVTDVALHHFANTDQRRAVVHYMQPHKPLVGEKKIIPFKISDEKLSKLCDRLVETDRATEEAIDQLAPATIEDLINNFDITEDDIEALDLYEHRYWERDQIKNGDLTDEQLQQAYRSNLRYVLAEVKRLIEHLDCKVIITSDHGEHLGEHTDELWRYNHPDRTHPVLREVPWFEVGSASKGKQQPVEADLNPEFLMSDADSSDAAVEEHLRALGYK